MSSCFYKSGYKYRLQLTIDKKSHFHDLFPIYTDHKGCKIRNLIHYASAIQHEYVHEILIPDVGGS